MTAVGAGEWLTYAICPGCGSKFYAPSGSAFHASVSGCCPNCGHRKPQFGSSWSDPDWPVKTLRFVSTASWRPSTWGTGYWEERGAVAKPDAPAGDA